MVKGWGVGGGGKREKGRGEREVFAAKGMNLFPTRDDLKRSIGPIVRGTALGAFYRRLSARVGKAKAIAATARKLAILVYRTLKGGFVYAAVS